MLLMNRKTKKNFLQKKQQNDYENTRGKIMKLLAMKATQR
jgi:hypothetical protein